MRFVTSNTSLQIAAALGLAAMASATSAQQVRLPVAPIAMAPVAPSLHIGWSGPSLTAADRVRLSAVLARADTMALENRVRDAARLYWAVVAEQRAAAEYPAAALQRIALMYFGLDNEYIAADVFMELAESAAEFGDATTTLRSLFDAALMYKRLGRNDRVGECVRRIWPLLKSPAIPESIRAVFAARNER